MSNSDIENIYKDLENIFLKDSPQSKKNNKVGVISAYKDGVLTIEGIDSLMMGEIVEVAEIGSKALVMNLERGKASALVIEPSDKIKEGLFIESTGKSLVMPVSENTLGRVIDGIGTPIDGKGDVEVSDYYAHEKIAPGVMTREPVSEPLETGILAIDSLVPIGKGQRELIIGDRQTGKTTIATDTILNQKGKDVICIYVAIGQRESKVSNVHALFESRGAMEYTTIISAPAASSAVMQFLAPYAASAVGEYFADQGKDVLIVYDDLSKHAVAYREMSLLLRRPPGREAYPGDVFYIHSRLLERAVKLNDKYGGGSITALPIIETQAGDVSAYIPTNVISITDGQIFLDTDLFNKGVMPAISTGLSVSRVGSAAQTNIMKKISGTMKLDLASFAELEAFSQFASELDDSTKATLDKGRKTVQSMIQKQNAPYELWEEVIIIWAVTKGYLDDIEDNEVQSTLRNILEFVKSNNLDVIKTINEDKKYSDELTKVIDKLLTNYKSK